MIALSTSLNVSEREHSHGIGVSDRLAKPVRFEALQAVLARRLLGAAEGESAGHSARMPLF